MLDRFRNVELANFHQKCMPRSVEGDLLSADPEIERSLRRRQRENRAARNQMENPVQHCIYTGRAAKFPVEDKCDTTIPERTSIVSITTWNDLAQKFCTKFFPPAKIAKLKHDISIFKQAFKSMVDSSANGSLSTKTIDEALKLYETMVENMTQSANAAQTKKATCEECGAEHVIAKCPILAQEKEQADFAQWGQRQQNNTYRETYNPSWKKHPTFLGATKIRIGHRSRAPSSLPSNTEVNPKEHAQAITTRNGVQLPERQVNDPEANREEMSPEVEETLEQEEQTKEPTPSANKENSRDKETAIVNPYEPPIPFPQRLKKQKMEQQYKKFLEVFKKLHINIPFAEALEARRSRDSYANRGVQCQDSEKAPARIERSREKLGLGEAKATTVTLQLADRSLTHPRRIIEDVLVKVEKFIFPADFLILDMEGDKDVPLILGRPFLATGRALIDVQNGQLILRLGGEHVSFNVFKAMKLPIETDSCFRVDMIDKMIEKPFTLQNPSDALEAYIAHSQSTKSDSVDIEMCARFLESNPPYTRKRYFEELGIGPDKS
ncbi:uncharacterized protein LOC111398341 [Olea europaea var. sylvestris]|uniref:uncharacterized protein LOC111398341 n=1 Tax=Olea europaea var. sylvestris TaxID=158386 RepID=UPI000C1D2C35|nr:uncharacterized protein LOC111398341 [Olea europaea var. sylvestris]